MDEKQTDIYYKLGEMHGDIKSILNEAKKTNGRVTKLEDDVNEIKSRFAKYTGIASAVIFLLGYIIPKLIDKI